MRCSTEPCTNAEVREHYVAVQRPDNDDLDVSSWPGNPPSPRLAGLDGRDHNLLEHGLDKGGLKAGRFHVLKTFAFMGGRRSGRVREFGVKELQMGRIGDNPRRVEVLPVNPPVRPTHPPEPAAPVVPQREKPMPQDVPQ